MTGHNSACYKSNRSTCDIVSSRKHSYSPVMCHLPQALPLTISSHHNVEITVFVDSFLLEFVIQSHPGVRFIPTLSTVSSKEPCGLTGGTKKTPHDPHLQHNQETDITAALHLPLAAISIANRTGVHFILCIKNHSQKVSFRVNRLPEGP